MNSHMKQTLQVVGALALVGWTGLGLFAWTRVGDGIQLTFAEETDAAAPDAAALLADRVDTLAGDLEALATALEGNFRLLAEASSSDAARTETQRALLEQRLGALEKALPDALAARESATALASALARVELLAAALPAPGESTTLLALQPEPAGETTEAPAGEVAAEALGTAVELAEPGASEALASGDASPATDPGPAQASTPAPEPEKRGFLAFQLPSRDFRFEGPQTFEVLGDLSRVGFDAKSTLHDFTGISNAVRGHFQLDLAHPERGVEGRVEIRSSSLTTGLEGRDEAMAEHLATEQFELIEFVPSGFTPAAIDPEEQTLSGRLAGHMTIRGVTRDVELDVSAHVDESRRLVVEGELPLTLGDYGVSIPDKLGVISVNEGVRVWLHLRTRARAPSSVL